MARSIFDRGNGKEVRIDLTPMIDAVFLLLVFFMVTTVFTQSHQLQIELPRAVNYDQLQEKKLNVSISPEGQLEINGRLVSMAELPSVLEQEKTRTAATTLIIKADAKTQHGYVIDVMEIANQAGVKGVSVETDELRETPQE
jgi:biopolymer transport protein ExbD